MQDGDFDADTQDENPQIDNTNVEKPQVDYTKNENPQVDNTKVENLPDKGPRVDNLQVEHTKVDNFPDEHFFTAQDDEDFDEDYYEERTYKVVYSRSRASSAGFEDKRHISTKTKQSNRIHDRTIGREHNDRYGNGRELHDRPSRSWSQRPDEHGQRPLTTSKSEERLGQYFVVTKYQVDYNNRNYIRSTLNKPGGLHRYALGRPLDWDIECDNINYLRSLVNAPKGRHRFAPEIKRKRVPDNDFLADSTGWELEYGPMFNQQEGDVPYMPGERRAIRGAYRYYGVVRNAADSDKKIQEKKWDFKELNDEELRYGAEFLQEDVQHLVEQKDRIFGRGGYRYYDDVERSMYDERPADPPGLEYRESYATLGKSTDDDMSEEEGIQGIRKGKPFQRTILKKIVTLGSPPPEVENMRYATIIQFVPGEDSQSFHVGQPLRKKGSRKAKKSQLLGQESQVFSVHNSYRTDAHSKKNEKSNASKSSQQKHKQSKKTGYQESGRGHKQSDGSETELSEKSSIYQIRKQDIVNFKNTNKSDKNSEDTDDDVRSVRFDEEIVDQHEVLKKFPPHIEERIYKIKKKISRPEVEVSGFKGKGMKTQGKHLADYSNTENLVDFKKHSKHPDDHGKSEKSKFEKYVNKNGSEIWVKTETSYTELHHE